MAPGFLLGERIHFFASFSFFFFLFSSLSFLVIGLLFAVCIPITIASQISCS